MYEKKANENEEDIEEDGWIEIEVIMRVGCWGLGGGCSAFEWDK